MYKLNDTIIAISSAFQKAPIGIIRISGENSLKIALTIFHPITKQIQERFATNGWIRDPKNNNKIDEAIMIYYKKPKSYTAEDMVELFTHGNPHLINKIVNLCIDLGARPAEKGEFTFRAFINGRIDLIQAEAVNELIDADSAYQAETFINKLEGTFSNKLQKVKEKLLNLYAEIEAEINFGDTDELELNQNYLAEISSIKNIIDNLIRKSKNKAFLSDSYKIAIVGKPNVGKSSLFNILLKHNRAIVSEIPGTTRDYITEKIMINHYPVMLIDTAGFRKAKNKIEKLGIEQTKKIINQSDALIMIFDGSKNLQQEDFHIIKEANKKAFLAIINKNDLPQRLNKNILSSEINNPSLPIINASMKTYKGLKEINKILKNYITEHLDKIDKDDFYLNKRQYSLLKNIHKEIQAAHKGLNQGISLVYISENVKAAIDYINELTGEKIKQDILEMIFSKFCIGK